MKLTTVMPAHTVSLECRDIPIKKVLVFNDRAELKRIAKVELQPGANEIHVKNMSRSYVNDSIRVDGRGDATIQEVLMQDKFAMVDETDSPKIAELRSLVRNKQDEVDEIKDQQAIIKKRIEVLDKMVEDISRGVLPKEGGVTVNDELLSSVSNVFDFYNAKSVDVRAESRSIAKKLSTAEEELQKLTNELDELKRHNHGVHSKICVVILESKEGGAAELDLVYQVFNCDWRPSYDMRVDTYVEKSTLTITYYAQVHQCTDEDWVDTPLVLSTAQPCLGGQIPELGTLEASFWRPPPPPQPMMMARGAPMMKTAMVLDSSMPAGEVGFLGPRAMEHSMLSHTAEQAMSTEFFIERPATILSSNDDHKVTIGIIKLEPQLVHECVPSKSLSVFLTASAVNTSHLPFLPGEASVYLKNSFIAKTHLKGVSPNERFSCSLGIDSAIKVEYKPAKKYHEQSGIINKSSSTVTEQLIHLKNTKKQNVLLIVKEHIPRSTDEKIKIRVLHPSIAPFEDNVQSVGEAPLLPREGARMTSNHNVEWTVNLAGGQIQDLALKWAIDHPKEEKIEFNEKF